ncbi:SAM-dependent methyltransferase [Putridiphycobacter roseus]|uniref:SAM-dependent methyltransferase n=1 Tax=Putridiphycobacter roseus TaxID=2219161 RepID=A0A2W1N1Y7_9FLAO|nr:class I SAM-dependent methyltransferase [Putridiphycobacter roseus]PZE18649.1 SAM-dependent methyltransferase [Putridiphycobacter roseus]
MQRTFTHPWNNYELLDAGNDQKLERWGEIITIRPDRNAYFKPVWDRKKWLELAHFQFEELTSTKGEWKTLKAGTPKEWVTGFEQLKFQLKLTSFKHVGLFPEQKANWDFILKNLKSDQKFLNLFGYTGGASLAARSVGADVFHCDSVKQINAWAKENMELSNLTDIHWVLEDALRFATREAKRGNTYDGIIMDPPAFGLGAKKERWKIEQRFPELLEAASKILNPEGFLIVNTYSPRLKIETINEIAPHYFPNKTIEVTKLCMKTQTGKTIEYGELTRVF